jgi:diguanylate cyclase (GGDEF)-like protein
MDNPVSGYNVFVLSSKMNNLMTLFEVNTGYYNLLQFSIDEIDTVLESAFKRNLRENNLVILHQSMLSEDVYVTLNKSFMTHFEWGEPYMVIVGKVRPKPGYIRDNFGEGHRFYFVPDVNQTDIETFRHNLESYLILLFQRLEIDTRLNEYIMDSFKNMVDTELIEQQKSEIEKLNTELKVMSTTDFLTRVLNRRAFFEVLEREKKRTIRDRWRLIKAKDEESDKEDGKDAYKTEPTGEFFDHYGRFSLLIIDIDHFKEVNDKHGHLCGDQVLRTVGQLLNSPNIFRENDTVGRYGGEEFTVILPETSAENAKIPAKRLSEELKQIEFAGDDDEIFTITVSIGIAEFRMTDTSNEDIIKRADDALYYAKTHGRDQVIIYDEQFNK